MSSKSTEPPSDDQDPALLADAMLGRLAKWLRLLGYDTAYAEEGSDHQIAARARAEGRILLTRDHALAQRKGISSLLVQSQVLEEQLKEVLAELGGPLPQSGPRCTHCNVTLAEATPDQVRAHVPTYVWRTHRQFHRCPSCGRIYWPGSHWRHVERTLAQILDQEGPPEAEVS
jgi:uncharacterized protein with PIN domain